MITSSVESITPHDAKELLAHNHVNRNLRDGVVRAYKQDMDRGRWTMTGEPIQISEQGNLLNGQHRLTALSMSKVAFLDMLVVRGLPEEAQLLMDQGAGRSVTDVLKMEYGDLKNATIVSSIARWLAAAPYPGPGFGLALKQKVSSAAALAAFRRHPEEIIRAAEKGQHLRRTVAAISPTSLGYCWFQFDRVDKVACQQYFYAFSELAFNPTGDPRKAAYHRIIKIMGDPDAKAGNWTSVAHVSVLTRAWNAWRRDEQIDTIHIRNHDGLIQPVKPI